MPPTRTCVLFGSAAIPASHRSPVKSKGNFCCCCWNDNGTLEEAAAPVMVQVSPWPAPPATAMTSFGPADIMNILRGFHGAAACSCLNSPAWLILQTSFKSPEGQCPPWGSPPEKMREPSLRQTVRCNQRVPHGALSVIWDQAPEGESRH